MAVRRGLHGERRSCRLMPALPLGTTSMGLTAPGGRGTGIQISRGVARARAGPLELEIRVSDTLDLNGNVASSVLVLEATHTGCDSCTSPRCTPPTERSLTPPPSAHFLFKVPQPGTPRQSPNYLKGLPQQDTLSFLSVARAPSTSTTPIRLSATSEACHEITEICADGADELTVQYGSPTDSWLQGRRDRPSEHQYIEAWEDLTLSPNKVEPASPPSLPRMHSAPYACSWTGAGRVGVDAASAHAMVQGSVGYQSETPLLRSYFSAPSAHYRLNVRRPFLRIASNLNRQAAQLAVRFEEGMKAVQTRALACAPTLPGVVGVAALLQHAMSAAVARAAQDTAARAAVLEGAGKEMQGVGAAVHVTMAGIMHTSGVLESATCSLHAGGAHHAAAVVHATLAAGHAAGVMLQATGSAMSAVARWGTIHAAAVSSMPSVEDHAPGHTTDRDAEKESAHEVKPAAATEPHVAVSSLEAVEAVGSVAEALMSVDGALVAVAGAGQVLGQALAAGASMGLGTAAGAMSAVRGVMDAAPFPSLGQVVDVLHVAGVGMRQAGIAAYSSDSPLSAVSAQLRATGRALCTGAQVSEPAAVASAAKMALKRTLAQRAQLGVQQKRGHDAQPDVARVGA